MELYAGAALSGMGYLAQKQRSIAGAPIPQTSSTREVDPRERPSGDNMYSSQYYNIVRNDEQSRSDHLYADARKPLQTGVVPKPAYADMFASLMPDTSYPETPDKFISLTGEMVSKEDFTHNNMQPFFSGTARQNMAPDAYASRLETFTGRGEALKKKQEVPAFFEPTAGLNNVCGMQNPTEFFRSHIEVPQNRANDFPIAQVRVGPGLGQGYTAEPYGGFQQANTRDYVMPKSIDELRVASKPKVIYDMPVQGPAKAVVTNRGSVGQVFKNRVDTFYEQDKDQWLRTTGAYLAETKRPAQNMKVTARTESHVEYKGVAGPAGVYGRGEKDDYGRSGVLVYDNERMVTETRTVVTNLTSMVKSVIAPFTDILKHSIKEYLVDAPREMGNLQAQMPSKPTVYDPINHMMRTTIKETTVHDTTILNPKGPDAGQAYTDDAARPTTRETMPLLNKTLNMASHTYRVVMYNPDEVARTTIKETTENAANPNGFVKRDGLPGGYTVTEEYVAKDNQKQTTSLHDHYGSASSRTEFAPRDQEAEQNMVVDPTREALNIASGYTPSAGGGYVGTAPESFDMSTKKPMEDSLAPRKTPGQTRVYQPTAMPVQQCAVTHQYDYLNGNENRLDPGTLSSLKTNPYNLTVNPLA